MRNNLLQIRLRTRPHGLYNHFRAEERYPNARSGPWYTGERVKRLSVFAGMFAALLAAWPVAAQQGPPDRRAERSGRPEARPMPQPQRAVRVEHPRPDEMTPEERRQLRRDIYDHGRDVYRDRRQKDRR